MSDIQFSTRDMPWMKLGAIEDSPKTAAEAAALGGLDFTVSKLEVAYRSNGGDWQTTNKRVAVVRDDTQELFEVVSPEYELFQYHEAFDFMDAINPQYVAAGSLKGGRQGFLVVRPENYELTVGGDDKHDMYIVLRASHDRTRAVEVSIMPLRHKCMNQMALASFSKGAQHRWSIPHHSTMRDKLIEAQHVMTQLDEYTVEFQRLAETLMGVNPTEEAARGILKKHITPYAKKQDDVLDSLLYLWNENEEQVGFNGTGWGLVNAVSEHFEWRRVKTGKAGPEAQFINGLQGQTYQAINKVTKDLMRLAS